MSTVLSILLIAVAGYGLYYFLKKRNEKAAASTVTPGKKSTSKKDLRK